MLAQIRDWHQTLSWKLGYGRGKEGRAYTCPWWVDKAVYALAYMQGKGVEIPSQKDGKPLTEPLRMLAALYAASYMRWNEIRFGKSPTAQQTQRFIKGLLDVDGVSYATDDPQMIEILALTLNVDMVETFIKEKKTFEALDRMKR
jgi:hypothetical protein